MRYLIPLLLGCISCSEPNSSLSDDLDLGAGDTDALVVDMPDAVISDEMDLPPDLPPERPLGGLRFPTEVREGYLVGLDNKPGDGGGTQRYLAAARDNGGWLEQLNFEGVTTESTPLLWKGRVLSFGVLGLLEYSLDQKLELLRTFPIPADNVWNVLPYGNIIVVVTETEFIFVEEGLLNFQITKRLNREAWTSSYSRDRKVSAHRSSYIFQDVLFEASEIEHGVTVITTWDLTATEDNLWLAESEPGPVYRSQTYFSESNKRIYTQGGASQEIGVFSMERSPEFLSVWDMNARFGTGRVTLAMNDDWILVSLNSDRHLGILALDPNSDEPTCIAQITNLAISQNSLPTKIILTAEDRFYVQVDDPQPRPFLPIQRIDKADLNLGDCP